MIIECSTIKFLSVIEDEMKLMSSTVEIDVSLGENSAIIRENGADKFSHTTVLRLESSTTYM